MNERAIALDSQLLVLLAVGLTDPAYVLKHKKTRSLFDIADFGLLIDLIGRRSLLLLPNTVTEASNHLLWHQPPERDAICKTFGRIVSESEEVYVASRRATERTEYVRLGVTDAALLVIEDALLLTTDIDLYLAAEGAGVVAVNFNHERQRNGLV